MTPKSALEALDRATNHWIRVSANLNLGAYEITTALNLSDPPKWPELTFEQILRVSFKDHHITDMSHPVLRKLRGEN